MKIYGNLTSPYVRRLRLLLAEQNYEFETVNVFGDDREKLKAINPTLKIPMFEDLSAKDCPIILDSQVAYQYLEEKLRLQPLSTAQQNDLALINSCNESFVNQLILKRSGVDITEDKPYFNIQRERALNSFAYFEQRCGEGAYDTWNYVSLSLLVLIEWIEFRNLYDLSEYPNLQKFVQSNQGRNGVQETKPSE